MSFHAQLWRIRTRGLAPNRRWITDTIAIATQVPEGVRLTTLTDRITVAASSPCTDVTESAHRFYVTFEDGTLACFSTGGEVWRARGDRERFAPPCESRERAQLWLGDGCAWTIESCLWEGGHQAGPFFVGRDVETGAIVQRVRFHRERAIRGVAEAALGIVVELDNAVIFVDRSGETVLAETLSPGRHLFSNGTYVIALDKSGRDAWVVAPGRSFTWWEFPIAATGLVLEDAQVRIDTGRGSYAFPLATLEGAIEAGVMRPGSPPSVQKGAEAMARGIAELDEQIGPFLSVPVEHARIECYRGHYDPSPAGDLPDCCDLAVGVHRVDHGAIIGLFVGYGGQRTGDVWARVARYALELLMAGDAAPAPEPPVSGSTGRLDEAELLVRAWLDRRALPSAPLERIDAIAARIGAVSARIRERWYRGEGGFGAAGALAWIEKTRAVVLTRGATRVYLARASAATVIAREHTLGATCPEIAPEHADIGLSSFDVGDAAAPAPVDVALEGGDRLAVLVGKVLTRPVAEVEMLVHARNLCDAARQIEQSGPAFPLNKWGAVVIENTPGL